MPLSDNKCVCVSGREFKVPWREAGPPNHHDDKVDSDQQAVNKELSLGQVRRRAAERLVAGKIIGDELEQPVEQVRCSWPTFRANSPELVWRAGAAARGRGG